MAKGIQIVRIAAELGITSDKVGDLWDFLDDPLNPYLKEITTIKFGPTIMAQALSKYKEVRGLVQKI